MSAYSRGVADTCIYVRGRWQWCGRVVLPLVRLRQCAPPCGLRDLVHIAWDRGLDTAAAEAVLAASLLRGALRKNVLCLDHAHTQVQRPLVGRSDTLGLVVL